MPVSFPYGFILATPEPIDSRIVVADHKGIDFYLAYNGLVVYNTTDKKLYKLIDYTNVANDNGWKEVLDVDSVPTLTKTVAGPSASLILSSSGTVTASLQDGLVWIVTAPANNSGETFIWSTPNKQWYFIPKLDQTAGDERYLKLAGGTMAGNITMGSGFKVNGTSSWAESASVATIANGVAGGQQFYIPYWKSSNSALTSSIIYQNNDNNIGIGTATPNTKLDVNGWINTNTGIVLNGSTWTDGVPASGGKITFVGGGGLKYSPESGAGFYHSFFLNGSSRLHINDNGIGIGTTNPSYSLHIDNTSTYPPSGSLNVNNTLYVSASTVGIKNANPTYNLDVNGTGRISNIYFNTGDSANQRIFANDKLQYQTNDTTNQHLFNNKIGMAFGGSTAEVVKIQAYDNGGNSGSIGTAILRLVGDNGVETTTFLTNGNVGIGKTSPTTSLDMIGTATISGSLKVQTKPTGTNISGGFSVTTGTQNVNYATSITMGNYLIETGRGVPPSEPPELHFNGFNQGLFLKGAQPYIAGIPTLTWGYGPGPTNASYLNMGVNSTGEYTTGGSYPSASNNYYFINTNLQTPSPTNVQRRSLYMGGQEIKFWVSGSSNVDVFSSTPAMSINSGSSVTINDVLTLTPRTTNPSNPQSGSIMVSGSGANCKPYFYNGSTWTAFF